MADNISLPAVAGTLVSTSDTTTLNGAVVTAQHVHRIAVGIRTAAATVIDLPGDATNGLDADVTRVIPGTAAAALGKAEDAAHGTGDTGVYLLTVRQDTPAGSTDADGDYQSMKTDAVGRLWVNGSGVTQPVSGTFWQATQPISGTVTANAGTGTFQVAGTSGAALALDATLTNGTAKAITRGGAKGTTAAADATSTAQGANNQALDVQIYHGAAAVNPASIRALTAADVVTAAQGAAAAATAPWAVRQSDGAAFIDPRDTSDRVGRLLGAVSISQTTPGTTNKVALSDTAGAAQYNFPAGFQRTTDEPRQLFYDPFDAALDTTDRWNTATAVGGGVAASVTAGVMTLGSGTTINGYSYLTTRATLMPTIPAWVQNSWAVQVEAGATAGNNAVRFWGAGSVGGTPSSTNPLGATGNGYGFELDTSGVLQAVVYANGTRTVVASLATSQPTDGAYHRYLVTYRTDRTYWYIDSLATPVATSNFQSPQVQALPLLALSVAHSVAPAASRVFTTAGVAAADTGKNHSQISDGLFPWRKATVKAASTAALATDSPLVVALHPSSPITSDADHDAVNTGKLIQVGGHASGPDVPPTAVSAVGDRVRFWGDRSGAAIVRPRRLRESYTAVYRLAEAGSRIDLTFTHTANTNKQLATLHHAVGATRDLRIQKVVMYANLLGTAAGFWTCELRAITGTPATGAPAITPKAHRLDAAATEAVCLALPTTGGTDATPNSPYASFIIDHGIEVTTQPTAKPQPYGLTAGFAFTLYDAGAMNDEVLPIILRAGTLEGVAIVSRDTAAMVLRYYAVVTYSEETP